MAEAEPRKLTEKLVGKGARYAFQGQKSLKVGKKRYAYRGTGDEKLDRTLTRGDKRWKKVSTRKEKIRYYNMSDISYLRKRGWELTDPCRSLVQAKAFKKGGYQDSDAMIIRTGKRGDVFPYHIATRPKRDSRAIGYSAKKQRAIERQSNFS